MQTDIIASNATAGMSERLGPCQHGHNRQHLQPRPTHAPGGGSTRPRYLAFAAGVKKWVTNGRLMVRSLSNKLAAILTACRRLA